MLNALPVLEKNSLLLVLSCQLSICAGGILTCCVSGQPQTHSTLFPVI